MQPNSFTFQGSLIYTEQQTSKAGKAYSRFTLRSFASADGKTKEATLNFVAFGYSHERLCNLLPNSQVLVIGKLGSSEHNGRYYPDFMVNELHEVTDQVVKGAF